MGWITTGANNPVYYWLWDAQQERFRYAFTLCNAEVDAEKQQLVSRTRDNATRYDTDYYQYDADGKLQNVKRIVETLNEDGTRTVDIYERVNGKLEKVA